MFSDNTNFESLLAIQLEQEIDRVIAQRMSTLQDVKDNAGTLLRNQGKKKKTESTTNERKNKSIRLKKLQTSNKSILS